MGRPKGSEVMERHSSASEGQGEQFHDPALLRDLLGDVRYAPLWLLPRVVVGWLWLEVGWGRLGGFPTPLGDLTTTSGRGMGDLLAFALTLLGIALMLGGFTGIVAFAGGCLSAALWVSAGPVVAGLHFAAVVWLVLAWKTAGWIGLDRWLLPALGLPWRGGALFGQDRPLESSGARADNARAHSQ
jgi:thiosulfate dehydrogenase [quinone] large subunit